MRGRAQPERCRSSGSPIRPIGLSASAPAAISGFAAAHARKAAVFAPGQITLAVTPVGAHSRAAVLVNARNASFAALYSGVPIWAFTPFNEHRLITRPQPWAFIVGKGRLHRPQRPIERHVHAAGDQLVGLVLHPADPSAAPRIVDQDVDGPPPIDRRGDHRQVVGFRADIGPKEHGVGPCRDQFIGRPPAVLLVDFGNEHLGTFGPEPAADRPTNAVASPGDHGNPALNASHNASCCWLTRP